MLYHYTRYTKFYPMSKFFCLIVLVFSLLLSCTQQPVHIGTEGNLKEIIKTESDYINYYYAKLHFDDMQAGYNEEDSLLSNLQFFEKMYSGQYFPLRVISKPDSYKLFKVNAWPIQMVRDLLRGVALQQMKRTKLIGYDIAQNDLITVYNETIKAVSLSHKTTFLKLWFVGCIPCVEEMPALNKIMQENKADTNILFISMAFSAKKDIIKLLSKTKFDYETVAVTHDFVFDTLGIQAFPTHIYVEKGKVKKILHNYRQIQPVISAIHKQL